MSEEKLWAVQVVKQGESGLRGRKMKQNEECDCYCKDLVVELIQTMKAQNEVMAKIMDQNNELMAQYDGEGEEVKGSRYLDG